MPPSREELARAFLQEAVYRSRETQAQSDPFTGEGTANCGLGAEAAVVLDLTARGRELLTELFGDPDSSELERIHVSMSAWIELQDSLDRKRNHFLKAFRHKNGFDRTAYDLGQVAEYERGLSDVNAQVERELALAVGALLGS